MAELGKPIKILLGTALLAGAACELPAMLPQQPDQEGTPNTEFVPASEIDSTYQGTIQWDGSEAREMVKPFIKEGLLNEDVNLYTIKIDLAPMGINDTRDVHFAAQTDLDGVTRDYMFSSSLQPNGIALLSREAVEINGGEWIRESYFRNGKYETAQEYPADTAERLAKGEEVSILFYPTKEMKAGLVSISDKPIEVKVSPRPIGSVVDAAATPFFSVQEVNFENPVQIVSPTPIPKTETPVATATLPAIVNGIRLLTPDSFITDEHENLVWVKTYELGDNPNTPAIKKGLTYGYVNIDPVHNSDFVVAPIVIYSPGAGAAASERAKNESTSNFSTCTRKEFKSCQMTIDQITDGSYGRWAQRMFGDKDHLVKIIVFPGATSFEKMGVLQSSLKVWETDQMLGIDTDVYLGSETKYKDKIVEESQGKNPKMFDDLDKFINTGDPTSLDGDSKVYAGVLSIH